MKALFFILTLLLPLSGLADIYKCKDSRQMVVYQDTPCTTRTIGTVKPVPAPSDQAVAEARRDLERIKEDNRYYAQLRQQEYARRQEELRYLEAQELRERELMAAEAYGDDGRYYPLFAPGFGPVFGDDFRRDDFRRDGFRHDGFRHDHDRHDSFHRDHRHHHRHFDTFRSHKRNSIGSIPRRPCVIGFVGDRSCR